MPKREKRTERSSPAGGKPIERNTSAPDERHLSNIEKLLSAAFELMKQEPSIDRASFEQLRQLRVRIRRSFSRDLSESDMLPPAIAPELFKNRIDKDEGAISFVSRTYSIYLGKSLSRADLKKLDKKLYNALYNLPNSDYEMNKIGLFTKKSLNDIKLSKLDETERPSTTLRIAELPPTEREKARLFNLIRRRKQRASNEKQ